MIVFTSAPIATLPKDIMPASTDADAAAAPAQRTSLRASPTRMMVLWSVALTLSLAVVAFLVTWLVADGRTASSVLIGAVLSVAVFGIGLVAIRGILAGPTQTTMAGAFLLFFFQLGLTAGALVILSRQSWIDMMALGAAFIAAGVVFQAGAVTGALRSRVTVDPDATLRPDGMVTSSATVQSDGEEVVR